MAALTGLEIGTRIAESGEPGQKINPAGKPYFKVEKQNEVRVYTPSSHFLPWGHGFRFNMPKPMGVFRIFCMGGSSTNGGAFGNAGAFALWLDTMLAAVSTQARYQVINSGQGGFPLSEVLGLQRQILDADPDLLILYSGNNEFFYHRAQPQAWEMPPLLLDLKNWAIQNLATVRVVASWWENKKYKAPAFEVEPEAMRAHAAKFTENAMANDWDRKNRHQIVADFRAGLEELVDSALDRGANVILCTVAVNMRDYEPYGYYHRDGINEEEILEWDDLVEQGKSSFAAGDYEGARSLFQKALAIDPEPALLNFYLGHALLRLGRGEEAYQYFQTAVDNDPVRDRTGSDLNETVREVAADRGVPLADIALVFRQRTADTVPGDDLFLDAVHPTLEGHKIIARTLLEIMVESGWVRPGSGWEEQARRAARNYQEKMPVDYLFSSYYTAASLNAFLGRFDRARLWAGVALEHKPGDPAGMAMVECLDTILRQRPAGPPLPWGRVEFARDYKTQKGK